MLYTQNNFISASLSPPTCKELWPTAELFWPDSASWWLAQEMQGPKSSLSPSSLALG